MQQRKKMLLVLPLLVLPFLTLFFWALGGGQVGKTSTASIRTVGGINLELPLAHNKERPGWTKLDYYKQADADSAKRKAAIARDPYYNLPALRSDAADTVPLLPIGQQKKMDAHEAKVMAQLASLEKQLKVAETGSPKKMEVRKSVVSGDVDRLEAMMHAVSREGRKPDPEMEQLSGMLDKIMALQDPGKIKAFKGEPTRTDSVAVAEQNVITVLGSDSVSSNQFYSLEVNVDASHTANAIRAEIAETQSLRSGAVIKLRLLQDIMVNGVRISADQFIYGTAQLSDERLHIDVKSIRYEQNIFTVKLSVYDVDGQPGIYIPGVLTAEVAKQSAQQSLQSIGLNTLDPSFAAQAAGAGIQAAKNLVTRRVREKKVTVTAGHQVFLK